MAQEKFHRHTAIKVAIIDLLNSVYFQEDDDTPNYLLTAAEQKIYRVNVLGTVLNIETVGSITNFLLDDGTGKIAGRNKR